MKNQAMQNKFLTLIIGTLLSVLLLVAVPWACAQDSPGGNGNNDANNNSRPAPNPLDQSYSASLNSGQAIPLTPGASAQQNPGGQTSFAPELHSQFFYGGSLSTVYVDTYNTTTTVEHDVSGVISPYFGVYLPTHTGGVTLQYQGTYTPNDAFTGGFQSYHALSFHAIGAFSRRWYWGVSSTGNYGSASAQFAGPLSYLLVGLTPVVDPIQQPEFEGRTVAFVQNAAEVGWRRSQRDRITLTAFHVYSDLSSTALNGGLQGDRSNAVGAKLDYTRDVTSRFKFDIYGQEEHVIESSCNTYGAGAGISAQLSYSWHLDLSGGPQWTSANCGQQTNFNFYGALVKALRGQAKVYAVAWQYYNVPLQATNTWEDAAAVGISQPLGNRFTVQVDAGYFRGDPLLVTARAFQGYFVSPLVRYKITDSTFISAGYRAFHATGGNPVPGSLNFATISLEWHPKAIQLGRQ